MDEFNTMILQSLPTQECTVLQLSLIIDPLCLTFPQISTAVLTLSKRMRAAPRCSIHNPRLSCTPDSQWSTTLCTILKGGVYMQYHAQSICQQRVDKECLSCRLWPTMPFCRSPGHRQCHERAGPGTLHPMSQFRICPHTSVLECTQIAAALMAGIQMHIQQMCTTFNCTVLDVRTPVFAHGQLYTMLSCM